MVYPVLLQYIQGFYTGLSVANLADPSKGVTALSTSDNGANDRSAAWSPDGKTLVVARQPADGSPSSGAQLYLIDPDTGDAKVLLEDQQYNHAAVSYDATGRWLVMQRLEQFATEPEPGIWVYSFDTKTMRLIAKNGYLPQWVP
jgi:dipeptidyl aminopeptidase/acylaminoacyl peptidase